MSQKELWCSYTICCLKDTSRVRTLSQKHHPSGKERKTVTVQDLGVLSLLWEEQRREPLSSPRSTSPKPSSFALEKDQKREAEMIEIG